MRGMAAFLTLLIGQIGDDSARPVAKSQNGGVEIEDIELSSRWGTNRSNETLSFFSDFSIRIWVEDQDGAEFDPQHDEILIYFTRIEPILDNTGKSLIPPIKAGALNPNPFFIEASPVKKVRTVNGRRSVSVTFRLIDPARKAETLPLIKGEVCLIRNSDHPLPKNGSVNERISKSKPIKFELKDIPIP